MIMRSHLMPWLVCLLLPAPLMLVETRRSQAQIPDDHLTFRPALHDTFSFDTGVLRGQLRTDQLAFGLHQLESVSGGKALAGRYGLMNVYRVFSDGQRYGVAGWEWPSRTSRREDGAVVIECPAESARPFQLRGIYRWRNPTTLDLEIQVRPQRELKAFEVFLASYFDAAFSDCQVNAKRADAPGTSGFLSAEKALGDWLMFPRDTPAVQLIEDGRWQLPPHPVQWEILPPFERPLVVRRDATGKIAVLLMARAADCFAVAMPYETEGHFSVYLSLFGRDLPPGEWASAKARLQVLAAPSEQEIIESFRAFEQQVKG